MRAATAGLEGAPDPADQARRPGVREAGAEQARAIRPGAALLSRRWGRCGSRPAWGCPGVIMPRESIGSPGSE